MKLMFDLKIFKKVFNDIRNADLTPNSVTGVPEISPAVWYILLRAIDR